ncbi:MAG: hypothetical protein CVU39_20025, partial [Chloroflexi bacterium HGW-Chloroflexi-10]
MSKNMKKNRLFVLLFSVFFVGCVAQFVSKDDIQTPILSKPTTLKSTLTQVAPALQLNSTATKLPTQVITPEIEKHCLNVQDKLPDSFVYPGRLVLENNNHLLEYNISFFDFEILEEISLNQNMNFSPSVSLDQTRLAVENYSDKSLEIYFHTGERELSIPWKEDWGRIADWLDYQRLVIIATEPDLQNPIFEKYPQDIFIYNPYTKEEIKMVSDYPGIDLGSHTVSWKNWGTTIVDSSLTRVIYPGSVEAEQLKGNNYGYILYDLLTNKKILELPTPYWIEAPIWANDGSSFLVFLNGDFWVVGKNGSKGKISNLNPEFDLNGTVPLNIYSPYYSWSPEMTHVAFWLTELNCKNRSMSHSSSGECRTVIPEHVAHSN